MRIVGEQSHRIFTPYSGVKVLCCSLLVTSITQQDHSFLSPLSLHSRGSPFKVISLALKLVNFVLEAGDLVVLAVEHTADENLNMRVSGREVLAVALELLDVDSEWCRYDCE